MVDGVASTSIQISSLAVSAAASDYCCNDPGCNCKGGREAKKALEARREQFELDQVSVSAAGLAALRAEAAPGNIGSPSPITAPQNTAAIPPPSPSELSPPPRNATETTRLNIPAERSEEAQAAGAANPAISAYLNNAGDAEAATVQNTERRRIDTYA